MTEQLNTDEQGNSGFPFKEKYILYKIIKLIRVIRFKICIAWTKHTVTARSIKVVCKGQESREISTDFPYSCSNWKLSPFWKDANCFSASKLCFHSSFHLKFSIHLPAFSFSISHQCFESHLKCHLIQKAPLTPITLARKDIHDWSPTALYLLFPYGFFPCLYHFWMHLVHLLYYEILSDYFTHLPTF